MSPLEVPEPVNQLMKDLRAKGFLIDSFFFFFPKSWYSNMTAYFAFSDYVANRFWIQCISFSTPADNLESPEIPVFFTPSIKIKKTTDHSLPSTQATAEPESPEIPAFQTPYLKQFVSAKKVKRKLTIGVNRPRVEVQSLFSFTDFHPPPPTAVFSNSVFLSPSGGQPISLRLIRCS